MNKQIPLIGLILCLAATLAAAPVSKRFQTKIVVNAIAADRYVTNAPAIVIYPEGEGLETLRESGAIEKLERSLKKMGYSLVEKESEAAVYIRVAFEEFEPYATDIEYRNRPQIDYSNSPSATNYAAIINGGRYKKLANPRQNREQNNAESILGPTGEIINLGEQKDRETQIIQAEEKTLAATIYPISLEVSAWVFDQDKRDAPPSQLWAVLAFYNNLRDEETQPQLLDLSETASRFLGKNLKKEKLVSRK
ncbi:hypothetical protein IEN85_20285 [Pelagicoccus sp. NFK12]|uniref:DUF4136 domain-containing protein n=1 Tax=Pelagicoccus enzymogenes TaxID=2773457 RepID=A0A927FDL9_9BACT|nr:hypothetical protein [Pelagicoccus enzymogenes]MBD5781851.1 hypothetical protein [Pelagicoccus enzymogenes]MDQ8196607.1 hypothetical protein [Pelagicoccus enzymogenes]